MPSSKKKCLFVLGFLYSVVKKEKSAHAHAFFLSVDEKVLFHFPCRGWVLFFDLKTRESQ